jgi:hypothetical protein
VPKGEKLRNEPNFVQAGVEIVVWESQKRSQIGHTAGEGTGEILNRVKQSQFPGVLEVVDQLEVQLVKEASGTDCHLALFCRKWLRLGG